MPQGNHPAIVRRLKRAHGHLQTIIDMVEKGRPCAQVAQQLQAVESAIESAKKALIHDHIAQSLEHSRTVSGGAGRGAIRAFKSVARYL